MSKLISLENVSLTFKKKASFGSSSDLEVLHDVSFTLEKGDSLGIIGRNGAGKSTLLKLMAGILDPTSGVVYRETSSISLLSIGAGFDNELNGVDNIYLNGLLLGLERKQITEHLEAIIRFSELEDSINKPISTYSSGMKARLGFSIAYNLKADVLLLDEVLGVGDIRFRKKSALAMKEKIKSNQTIALVSHNASNIKNLCNKALWIEDGRSIMYGAPKEVIAAYNDKVLGPEW